MNKTTTFRRSKSRTRRGFTLIELLVVIVIIAVLGSLVTIGAISVRNKALASTATTRVSALQVANLAYAADNGGRFVPTYATSEDGAHPAARQWIFNPRFLEQLASLDSTRDESSNRPIFEVPEEILDPKAVKAGVTGMHGNFGYVEENMPGGSWGEPGSEKFHSSGSLSDPSRVAAFVTSRDWLVRYSGRYIGAKDEAIKKSGQGDIAYRHDGKAIVVFYDGHTELIDVDDMKDIDRAGKRNNAFWGGDRGGRGR